MILHLQWNNSVFRNTLQQQWRGLTWCIGYLRTSFYSVQLLPLCLQERKTWAKLICLSGTVSIVLFVLFFFQAVAYKKGWNHKCMGTLSGGVAKKGKQSSLQFGKDLIKITFNFCFFFSLSFWNPFFVDSPIMHGVFDLSCRVSRAKRDRRVHNEGGDHAQRSLFFAPSSPTFSSFLLPAPPVSHSCGRPQHCHHHQQRRNTPFHSNGHWTGLLLPCVSSGGW